MEQLLSYIQSATFAYQCGMLDMAKEHALNALSQLSLYTKDDLPDYLMHKLNILTLLQSIASRQHDTTSYSSYEPEVQSLMQQLFPEYGLSYYGLHLLDAFECYLDAGEIITAQYLLEKGIHLLLSEHEPCPLLSFVYDTFQAKLLFRMEQYHACIDTCLRANESRWSEALIPNDADDFLQQYAGQESLITAYTVLYLLLLAQSYGKINSPEEGLPILEALHENQYDFYLQASIELALAELYTRADMSDKALPFYQKYRQAEFAQYPDLQSTLSTLAVRLAPAFTFSNREAPISRCYSKDAYHATLYNHGLLLVHNEKYTDALSIFSQLGDKGLSMYISLLAHTGQFSSIPQYKKKADHYYEQEIKSLFLYYDEKLVYNHLSLLEYHFSLCMKAYVTCHQEKGETALSAKSIYDFLLNTKYISLEASYLSHHYRTLEELKDRKSIRSAEIMKSLPKDTILLEYCITRSISDEQEYAVFVVTAQQIYCVPLGPAQELHHLLSQWNTTLHASRSIVLSDSEPTPMKSWHKEQRDTDTALRRFLFLPMKEILAQCPAHKLLIAPVGALAAFPFDMLSVAASDYLGNRYEISYINTGKELLQTTTAATDSLTDNPLLIGNPATLSYSPLPFAEEEILMAAKILNVYAYTGTEAVLSLFDQSLYQAPTLLHIASHGAYHHSVTDELLPGREETENTMELSGLVLADDSLLSCNMIANLDLSNTTLAILSACQSGSSLFHSSEGAFGLRRAFKLANCKYILATLWHIDDRSCSLFISYFYEELFCLQDKKNYNIPTAFHNAITRLREYQEYHIAIYSHPYYWAGYILIE